MAAMVITTCAVECAQCRENPLLAANLSQEMYAVLHASQCKLLG